MRTSTDIPMMQLSNWVLQQKGNNMADYKYEAETIRIMELSSAIKVIAEHVDDFSYEIETEDVLKLQRQLKNAVKTADRIVEHLSSLNTKEDREAYIKT